jgi:phosphatidylserine/phosphatidylglycerophosphate/cardiolipin synthase-like enzyme
MSFLRPTKRTHERNEWRPIIDGETAYGELLAAMRAAKRFIYIATWEFDPGLELTRTGSADPTVREVLLERARAGIEVKVLVWDILSVGHQLGTLGNLFRPDIGGFKRELIDAGARANKGTGLFLTVNPSRPAGRQFTTGSDHQKFWVIDDAGKHPFGFVGGLNLGQHEWDTREHRAGDRRRTRPGINRQGLELQDALNDPVKQFFVRGRVEQALNEKFQLAQRLDKLALSDQDKEMLKNQAIDLAIAQLKQQKPLPPRHDVTSRIRGPAAAELLEEFRVRWRLSGSGKLEEKSGAIPSPGGAKTKVQVGHTAYYPGPGDKQDIWRAYLHALKQAERFIYLENQYFTSPSVRNVIVERIQRRPKLQVVIILPRKPEEFGVAPAITLRQSQLIGTIEAAAKKRTPREKRVHVFGLAVWNGSTSEYEDIYVHAKVGIIDDEWMTIGSANTGSRSFEFDTELNAFTNDITQVADFRRELWSEHLNIAKDDNLLKSPVTAIKKMAETAEANGRKRSGELTGRLVPMTFDLPAAWLRPLYEDIANEFL